jgi:hypothetical protein
MVKKAAKKVAKKGEFIPKNSFVFVGNGDSDPAWISMGGYLFGLNGRAIEVDEKFARKLRGNNHFVEK